MRFLFLLFIIIPIIEITVLIHVGQAIGAWSTVGLVLLSAFIGVNMLRYQGLSTLLRARERMNSGEIPANEMLEGLILAVGGALLITPGFVTDFFGFCCLVPFTRRAIVAYLRRHFTVVTSTGTQQQYSTMVDDVEYQPGEQQSHESRHSDNRHSNTGTTYEGEYRRDD